MKITVERCRLLEALKLAKTFFPSRPQAPANIMITPNTDSIIIEANSVSVFRARIDAEIVDSAVEFGVNLEIFSKFCNQFNGKDFVINVNNDTISLTDGNNNCKFKMPTAKAEKAVAAMEIGDNYNRFIIGADIFRQLIQNVRYAICRNNERPRLFGMFMKMSDSKLTLVGTDGQRLALAEREMPQSDWQSEGIIPHDIVASMSVMLDKIAQTSWDTEVMFEFMGECFIISAGNYSIESKFVNEVFPDYAAVFPTNNDKEIVFNRHALELALKKLKAATGTDQLVEITVFNNSIGVFTRDFDEKTSGSMSLEIQSNLEECKSFTIGFNGILLAEILANMKSEYVKMSMLSMRTAVLITPAVQEPNETLKIIIMPLMIREGFE